VGRGGQPQGGGDGQRVGQLVVVAGHLGVPAVEVAVELKGARRGPGGVLGAGVQRASAPSAGHRPDRQARGQLQLDHGRLAVPGQVRGVRQGVAQQQPQHDHVPLRVAEQRHRLQRVRR
jgi:hypothetical protein